MIYTNIFQILVEYANTNALVNRCDHYDNSPLHIAALKGFANIVEVSHVIVTTFFSILTDIFIILLLKGYGSIRLIFGLLIG